MTELEVYIDQDCFACRRAQALALEIGERFPEVRVKVVDRTVARGRYDHLVVATPTYILNGRVFKLGNPSKSELERALSKAKEVSSEPSP